MTVSYSQGMRRLALRTYWPLALAAALLAACAQTQPGTQVVTVDVPGPWDFANYGEGRMEIGEVALVSRQVLGCWRPPEGLDPKRAPDFVIRAQIDRQAVVTASELLSPEQGMQDPQPLALVESAREALSKCGPLHLPAEKYESWRQLDFRFSARQLPLVASWRRAAAPAVARSDETAASPSGGGSSAMSLGEIDEVRNHISSCWDLPAGVHNAADLAVEVRLYLNPDGSIEKVQVSDRERLQDPDFRAAAEAAVRAVRRCGPPPVPPGKYEVWREIVLQFDPSMMLEQ